MFHLCYAKKCKFLCKKNLHKLHPCYYISIMIMYIPQEKRIDIKIRMIYNR